MTPNVRPTESTNLSRPARPQAPGAPAKVAPARRHVYLTAEERAARGRAARREAPRSSHRGWKPPAGRLDPIALLHEQCESRVPELVPIRHGRMLTSPFAFFRGAAGKGNAFDRAIADSAAEYADQNERDFDAFVEAVKSGRLAAQTGV